MISDGGNFGFMSFGLLGLWVFFFFFLFFLLLVFLVLLRMGFLVFDFFFFCGFGCDCGLWLKWRFGGCVGGDLLAVVVVAMGYVGRNGNRSSLGRVSLCSNPPCWPAPET